MHLGLRPEGSSNKSAQHWGPLGPLTCVTVLSEEQCEGYYGHEDKHLFKYIGDGKCCTWKRVSCQEGGSRWECEGKYHEERKNGWMFLGGKCCLDLDVKKGWFGWRQPPVRRLQICLCRAAHFYSNMPKEGKHWLSPAFRRKRSTHVASSSRRTHSSPSLKH